MDQNIVIAVLFGLAMMVFLGVVIVCRSFKADDGEIQPPRPWPRYDDEPFGISPEERYGVVKKSTSVGTSENNFKKKYEDRHRENRSMNLFDDLLDFSIAPEEPKHPTGYDRGHPESTHVHHGHSHSDHHHSDHSNHCSHDSSSSSFD